MNELNKDNRIIYACSGASDLGKLSDEVVRNLREKGFGKMTCLSAIGGGIESYLKAAENSEENMVIDGCPVACGKKILEKYNLNSNHIILTDFGLKKGEIEISEKLIEKITKRIIGDEETKYTESNDDSCFCQN